jgi:hypothetical protein
MFLGGGSLGCTISNMAVIPVLSSLGVLVQGQSKNDMPGQQVTGKRERKERAPVQVGAMQLQDLEIFI